MKYFWFYMLCFLSGFTAEAQVKNGTWRGAIIRKDAVPIYFNFEIRNKKGVSVIEIKNGAEKIVVNEVNWKGDSLFFQMPFYESSFRAKVNPNGVMEGVWSKWSYDTVVHLNFEAIPNIKQRFSLVDGKAKSNISGKWDVTFYNAEGTARKGVGTFHQKKNHLTGSFVTPTGDFRFLEGVVTGNQLRLSTFDGGLAYYFEASIENDSIKEGKFYIGGTRVDTWSAHKNDQASVDLSEVVPQIISSEPLSFNFRDVSGNEVSLSDKRFDDKIIVLQIMGSWCPNCMDETKFLSEIYQKYQSKNVEIIGLAYELSTDFERSQKSLQRVIERFDVKYPILITGVKSNDEEKTKKTIPQISAIHSFPTTIFLNKKKEVVKVHVGFAGPGTEGFYDQYVKEFKHTLESLIP